MENRNRAEKYMVKAWTCFIRAVLTCEDRETAGKEPQLLEDNDGALYDPAVAGRAPS